MRFPRAQSLNGGRCFGPASPKSSPQVAWPAAPRPWPSATLVPPSAIRPPLGPGEDGHDAFPKLSACPAFIRGLPLRRQIRHVPISTTATVRAQTGIPDHLDMTLIRRRSRTNRDCRWYHQGGARGLPSAGRSRAAGGGARRAGPSAASGGRSPSPVAGRPVHRRQHRPGPSRGSPPGRLQRRPHGAPTPSTARPRWPRT